MRRAREHFVGELPRSARAGLEDRRAALGQLVAAVVARADGQEPATEPNLRMSFLQLELRRIDRELRRAAEDADRPRQDELASAAQRCAARDGCRDGPDGMTDECVTRMAGRAASPRSSTAAEAEAGRPLRRGRCGHRRAARRAARAGGRGRGPALPSLDRPRAAAHPRGRGAAGQADRDERHVGEERADRGEPAARGVDRQALHRPRADPAGPDPGGQPRADPRGREVRLAPRLQVLDLRHLVDPPGDHARAGRPVAHDPHPGAHGGADEPGGRAPSAR